MKRYIHYLIIAVFFLTGGCQEETDREEPVSGEAIEFKGKITISGAHALAPLMEKWAEIYTSDKPDLTIEVMKTGSRKGIMELKEGKVNMAMASRELAPEEECMDLWIFPVSREGILPIVSSDNPFMGIIREKGIKRERLKMAFSDERFQTWNYLLDITDNKKANLYIRSDSSGASDLWAEYLSLDPEELTGAGKAGDEGIVRAVAEDPLALSYCNAHYAYNLEEERPVEGLEIAFIDFNSNGRLDAKEKFYDNLCMVQRAAYLGKYPRCLCRELLVLINPEHEDPIIIDFIKWIYRKGQKTAEEEGYARIRHCCIEEILGSLEKTTAEGSPCAE